MPLTSLVFLAFLGIICIVTYLTPAKVRYIWLFAASCFFYVYSASGSVENLSAFFVMLAIIALTYVLVLGMSACKPRAVKAIFLVFSLLSNLLLLAACKYCKDILLQIPFFANFFPNIGTSYLVNLALPLGLSFVTLQCIGYSLDVFRGNAPAEKNPLRYAAFASFFPGVVAGPQNRAQTILPALHNPLPLEYARLSGGLYRVLWGMFKKIMIADTLAAFTSKVFLSPLKFKGLDLLLALLLFAYQLYIDFSSYSDIAIGAAYMLGFSFDENFQRPFAAKTFSDLWQRWHISLVSLLRDAIAEPLAKSGWTGKLPFIGAKIKKPPTSTAIFLLFAVYGAWHGPNTSFIVWGILTGTILAISDKLDPIKNKIATAIPIYRTRLVRGTVQRGFVYLLFSASLLFFAAGLYSFWIPTYAANIFVGWEAGFGELATALLWQTIGKLALPVLPLSIIFVEIIEKLAIQENSNVSTWIRSRYFFVRWPLYYVVLLTLLFFGNLQGQPFIYRQF